MKISSVQRSLLLYFLDAITLAPSKINDICRIAINNHSNENDFLIIIKSFENTFPEEVLTKARALRKQLL